MKSLALSLFTVLFLGLYTIGFAQDEKPSQWCGTEFTESMMDQVQSVTERYMNGTLDRSNPTYDIPITLHNMRNSDGSGGVDILKTLDVFCEVIEFYAQYGINLYINEIKTHDNSNWTNDPNGNNTWGVIKLLTIGPSGKNNTINIYNFKNLYNEQLEISLCGYFTGQYDVVAFANGNGCFSMETIAHEIGHYFSLPHTFFGFEGTGSNCGAQVNTGEKVDGSNCATAADRICDTPPDNNADRIPCPGGTGCQMYDSDGVAFMPDVTNIMSYFADNCLTKFTEGQRVVMHNNIAQQRTDLLELTPPNTGAITEAAQLIQPGQDDVKPYDVVTFQWSNVNDADSYYFEINRNPNFSSLFSVESSVVNTTSYISTELDPDRTYHWRVVPFNTANPCFSDNVVASGSFSTNDIMIDVEDVQGLESFDIFPNPAKSNQSVIVTLQSKESMEGDMQVYNVNGQLIQHQNIQVEPSVNSYTVDVQDLPAGLYVVHLEFEEGTVQKKLIIN